MGNFKGADIRPSFLQKFPKISEKKAEIPSALMPTAPETFNLRDFDLVISSSSAFAKGIIVKPKTIHICYCHSPMRYAWDWNERYLNENDLGPKRENFRAFASELYPHVGQSGCRQGGLFHCQFEDDAGKDQKILR